MENVLAPSLDALPAKRFVDAAKLLDHISQAHRPISQLANQLTSDESRDIPFGNRLIEDKA